tara:strand:- start:94 stop:1017 length:924 start_codon:yes stop_codon:yes gene_type:complete
MGNNQIKQQYISDINNGVDYDAYKIFDLPREFSWDQLKNAYKKLAMKTHPDKGGDKRIFDYITKKFYELGEDYKLRIDNKNYNELKEGYNNYQDNNNDKKYNDKFDDELSFNERLNKHFDSVKLYDEDTDFGYGNTMHESTSLRDDIKIKNVFNTTKVNNKSFNEVFDNSVKLTSKQIIKHTDPVPMILAKNLAYSEIGAGKNDDYSSSVEKTKNLAYTDYNKAHTMNRLIDSNELNNIQKFKNVKDYKKYSDNKIKKGLTEKELKQLEKKKQLEEEHEQNRLERIKLQNINITNAYNKANELLLKN